jgi:hypothetical protein
MNPKHHVIVTSFGTVVTFDNATGILGHHDAKKIPGHHSVAIFIESEVSPTGERSLFPAVKFLGFPPGVDIYSDMNVARPIGALRLIDGSDGYINLAESDKFLCAEPNGKVHNRRERAAAWETFLLIDEAYFWRIIFVASNSWVDSRRKTLVLSDNIRLKRKFILEVGTSEYSLQEVVADLAQSAAMIPSSGEGPFTEFSLHREGWKLEHYTLFKPLIYLAVYGSEVEEQLRVCLDSLVCRGHYRGTVLIIHNSTSVDAIIREHPLRHDIVSWIVEATDRLDYGNLRFFLPKWRHATEFQPILYVDADVIFDLPVQPILLGIASLDRIAFQVEPFSKLSESRLVGADLFNADGGVPAEPKNGFNSGVMGIPDLPRFSSILADIACSVESYSKVAGDRGIPYCFNQPHANYVCSIYNKLDGEFLTSRVRYVDGHSNISHEVPLGLTHVWGPRGRKHLVMRAHLNTLLDQEVASVYNEAEADDGTHQLAFPFSPPSSDAGVLAANFQFSSASEYISFDIGGLVERGRYRAEMWVYIPGRAPISSVALIHWGYKCSDSRNADPNLVDGWQLISVVGELPSGQTKSLLRLCVTGSDVATLFFTPPSLKLDEKRSSLTIIKASNVFDVVTFDRLLNDEATRVRLGIKVTDRLDDVEVPLAPISFGQVAQPEFPVQEHPNGGWSDQNFRIDNRATLSIPEATVHTDQGIITFQGCVLKDSIRLADVKFLNAEWIASQRLSLAFSPSASGVDQASYHFAGYPGNRNYAHWVVDILPTLPLGKSDANGLVHLLMPEIICKWQTGYLDLLPELNRRMLFVGQQTSVTCRTLMCASQAVTDSGHFPNPERMILINELVRRTNKKVPHRRRIYVSRQDSSARRLLNEQEVILLVESLGFDVIQTSRMLVEEQIDAFSSCDMVVGPHGAGMANVIFCRPGTPFLELMTDSYVQWSMRRLASVSSLRYGCVLGHEIGSSTVQQEKSWVVDVDLVRQAIIEVL